MIFQGKKRYPVHEVVLHCLATLPDWMAENTSEERWAEVRRWHVGYGWRREGYHRGGDRDGTVLIGRSMYEIGAGVKGHNRGVLHYALFGGHGAAADDRFEDHFTEAQRHSLKSWLKEVSELTDIRKITGHNQYAAKGCPGFQVRMEDWL